MGAPAEDDLNGFEKTEKYDDGTVVSVLITRTTRGGYPSGWAYKLHFGTTEPDPPRSLRDGTIRRYDNAHELAKGHELHLAPDPKPETIEFPGMVTLWRRFWSEIPKEEFRVD